MAILLSLWLAMTPAEYIARQHTIQLCHSNVIMQYRADHKEVAPPGSDDYQARLNACLIANGIKP